MGFRVKGFRVLGLGLIELYNRVPLKAPDRAL